MRMFILVVVAFVIAAGTALFLMDAGSIGGEATGQWTELTARPLVSRGDGRTFILALPGQDVRVVPLPLGLDWGGLNILMLAVLLVLVTYRFMRSGSSSGAWGIAWDILLVAMTLGELTQVAPSAIAAIQARLG